MKRLIPIALLCVVLMVSSFVSERPSARDVVHATFHAQIDTIENIYDGDTLNKVAFKLPISIAQTQGFYGEVYPSVFLQRDGVWIHINVRIGGIDTPERHPRHKYPDGTLRPADERAREHALAMQARAIVVRLLVANDLKFEIRDPQQGKYAGRIVASVWVLDPDTNRMVNIADKLIDAGLAYPYEGGTKRVWK